MSHDAINSWVEKSKAQGETGTQNRNQGVQVIKRSVVQSKGNIIMEIAEKIRPWLMKLYEGIRDENGMLLQPARVRAIAINVAEGIVKEQEEKYNK